MEKFTSIESFKHIVGNVRKHYNKINKPFPTLNFEGTVKLHGTNAGVRRSPSGKIQPQSKERIIDTQNDNAGFAFFVETNKEAIENLFASFPKDADVTLFGEWCGGNIQKSVALAALGKHWVLFKVLVNGVYAPLPRDLHDNANRIYNIYQIPTYHVEINFTSPEPASEYLSDVTLEVEKNCPWATFMGAEGDNTIGEGIVWTCVENPEMEFLWFKTKGLLHKGNDKTKQPKIKIEDQKLDSVKELVDEILPQWRLEQGLSYLKENGYTMLPESTGEYIKWICKDIHKEELETIAAAGFEWKQIQGQVCQAAKQYWFKSLETVE
jgi:hypothetical protein